MSLSRRLCYMLLARHAMSAVAWRMPNAGCKRMMQTFNSQRQILELVGWRRCYRVVHFSQHSLLYKAQRCDFSRLCDQTRLVGNSATYDMP